MALLNTRALALLGASAATATLLYYFAPGQTPVNVAPVADAATLVQREEPDLYGENITYSEMRDDGSLQYRLRAQTIEQFQSQALTRLLQPDLHLTSADQPPWDIAANHGYMRSREIATGGIEEVVYLREQVVMTQKHPRNGVLTLRSSSIHIYPDRQYAETDQNVIIDTEVGRTRAAGMVADLSSGVLTLSSNASQRVHTIVLPEQFKKS